jgi:hypothetical protein
MSDGPTRKDWAVLIERIADCEERLDTLEMWRDLSELVTEVR